MPLRQQHLRVVQKPGVTTRPNLSENPELKALSAAEEAICADLHCHSTASDGILSPAALVSRAKSRGVTLLALTDHDTVGGLPEAAAACRRQGVALVPAIEFSSRWGKRPVHIVGLDIDPNSPALREGIALRERLRRERAERIATRLEKRGFEGALKGARALAGDGVIGRPHFARWLVQQGYVEDSGRAFKRYLGAGKVADVKVEWPQLSETVACIRAANGVAVLAHPLKYNLSRTQLRSLLRDFAMAGGEAIELLCGRQNPVQTRELRQLMEAVAAELARPPLHCSLGSDFHQPEQPWRELGCVRLPEGVQPVWALLGR
ncbi:PHP domain-containing protein [Microbulbifer thermotolerans]|uniref:PHP domain-containing protein n=1 Tax=Microbulbifer thermotolerans TaxID=252514 RepID=UPI0022492033|nr:PHP domain-containing protein [Microbulbifer thermotolerans]MCX2830249.1 PHP domain-containing protein [Microbulbifer thermotolerans]